MRQELVDCLDLVADPEQTRRVWIDHDPAAGWLLGGWLPAHILSHIDDCACLDDPASMLGVTLASELEVELVRALAPSVEALPIERSRLGHRPERRVAGDGPAGSCAARRHGAL